MTLATLWKTLLAGSAIGTVRIALAIPMYLVLTPLILNSLGTELFGLWSLNTIILSLLNMTDLGLKNSVTYHVARDHEQPHATRRHFTIAVVSYTAICLMIVLFTYMWSESFITTILRVPASLHEPARFIILITVVTFIVRLLSMPFQAVLEGHQKWSLSQSVLLLWLLAHAATTSMALMIRPDIYGFGIAGLASNLTLGIGYVLALRARLPHVTLDLSLIRWGDLRPLWHYGTGIQVAAVAIALREPLYKIVLARSYDFATLGTFEIAFKLCLQFMSLFTLPLMGVLGVSALFAARQQELERFLRPLFLYSLGFLPPLAFLAFSTSETLFALWLGRNGTSTAQLFPFLLAGFACYYVSEVLYKSIEGSGRSWYSATIQTIILAVQMMIFIASPPSPWSLAGSLLAGFFIFTVANVFMFRRCYPAVRLLTATQLAWLLIPSGSYLVLLAYLPGQPGWGWLCFYLCAHAFGVKNAAQVNLGTCLRRLMKPESKLAPTGVQQ